MLGNLSEIDMRQKRAFLTIDDGPSQTLRNKIDYLFSKSIPAVLFCQGSFLEQRAEQAIYAIEKGYIIGNHSFDHPYFSTLEIDQCFSQIERTDKIIDQIYEKANTKRAAKYFRFPHGDKGGLQLSGAINLNAREISERKQLIQNFLHKLGYSKPKFETITYPYYKNSTLSIDLDWMWTYDVTDWKFRMPHQRSVDVLREMFSRMDEHSPENYKGLNYPYSDEIVLIHDHPESDDIFMPVIERLLFKGIVFAKPE